MTLLDRFLKYVRIPTSSDDKSDSVPTTEKQFKLADILVEDMKEIGIEDAHRDGMCYIYGHIPATPGYENRTRIGFIAHMDTSPDFSDFPVNPQIHENYDGENIVLSDSGRVIETAQFPHLKALKGKTLITTDGHTLLGADDKSGVSEILHAADMILKNGIPHGPVVGGSETPLSRI